MITPQLLDYVRRQLAASTPKETITKMLAQQGWSAGDIQEAFNKAAPAPLAAVARTTNSTPARGASKKILLSAVMIGASAVYAGWVYVTGAQQPPATLTTDTPAQTISVQTDTSSNTSSNQIASTQPAPTQTPTQTQTTPTQTQPTATPTPAPKPAGQYVDGTYTGSPADAYYGTIQVKATVSGGKLTNVTFLQYPNDRSTSRQINGVAMPRLTSEAIAAQSANVDIVSGATDSSQAFIQSLGSALAQAKNA